MLQKMQEMKKRMDDEQKQRDAMYYVGVSDITTTAIIHHFVIGLSHVWLA